MASLRSVLFVDFDNIFGGLMELDRTAGMAFARQPQLWLDRLSTYGLADEGRRRFLQCRTYLNPGGRIKTHSSATMSDGSICRSSAPTSPAPASR